MVPHSWLIKPLHPFGAADNTSALISNRMSTWKIELTGRGKILGRDKHQEENLPGRQPITSSFYRVIDLSDLKCPFTGEGKGLI